MNTYLTFFLLIGTFYAKEVPFSFLKGEVLKYDISYGFITAGTASLEVHKTENVDETLLLSMAKSDESYDFLYEVRDTVRTIVSTETLQPSSFLKILNEGGWHNRVHIGFNDSMTAHLQDSVFTDPLPEGKLKRFKDTLVTLDGPTHTITSAFYLFRTLELKPGSDYYFDAVSGKKKYKLKVVTHGKEKIEVEAGTFNCIKVEPVLDEDGLFRAKGKLTIWLTDDEFRIPVLVRSKVAIGSISVSLKSWSHSGHR